MDDVVQFLKVFSDKNRLRILKLLEQRKMCVCELAYVLNVTQPAVSRHLKKMKTLGIIGDEQDRFWTNYYLIRNSSKTKTMLSCLKHWLGGDKTIKADLRRLKTVQRTKVCCR